MFTGDWGVSPFSDLNKAVLGAVQAAEEAARATFEEEHEGPAVAAGSAAAGNVAQGGNDGGMDFFSWGEVCNPSSYKKHEVALCLPALIGARSPCLSLDNHVLPQSPGADGRRWGLRISGGEQWWAAFAAAAAEG